MRDKSIPLDLEKRQLFVRSNATKGSSRTMWIGAPINNAINIPVGIKIMFGDTVQYVIAHCTFPEDFPIQPDLNGGDVIWKFSKSETSLSIWGNGVKLLEYNFASSNESQCQSIWQGDVVESIVFSSAEDNASAIYTAPEPLLSPGTKP